MQSRILSRAERRLPSSVGLTTQQQQGCNMMNPSLDPVQRDRYGNRMYRAQSNAGYWIGGLVIVALIIGGIVWARNDHNGTSTATNNGPTTSSQTMNNMSGKADSK